MVDYKKELEDCLKTAIKVSAGIALLMGLSRGCSYLPTPIKGNYRGHTVEFKYWNGNILSIDGKAGGRLRAEDRPPFGNWDGLEDEITLTGVSEADSLYSFVYPEVLREVYEQLEGGK